MLPWALERRVAFRQHLALAELHTMTPLARNPETRKKALQNRCRRGPSAGGLPHTLVTSVGTRDVSNRLSCSTSTARSPRHHLVHQADPRRRLQQTLMQNRSCPWRRFWFAIALCILTCPPARAHSIFQAALLLDYHANSVDVELQLPASRLEKVFGHELTASTLPALQPELSQYLLARMHAQSLNGSTWTVRLSAPRLGAHRRSSLHRCFFPAAALATKFRSAFRPNRRRNHGHSAVTKYARFHSFQLVRQHLCERARTDGVINGQEHSL